MVIAEDQSAQDGEPRNSKDFIDKHTKHEPETSGQDLPLPMSPRAVAAPLRTTVASKTYVNNLRRLNGNDLTLLVGCLPPRLGFRYQRRLPQLTIMLRQCSVFLPTSPHAMSIRPRRDVVIMKGNGCGMRR